MPSGLRPVFLTRHKVTGNILPIAILLVVGLAGAFVTFVSQNVMVGWPMLVLAPVLSWLSVNALGLWDNAQLRLTMERRLRFRYPHLAVPHYFVGFAHPAYRSILDPHEDVGFLILHDDHIEFFGGEFHIDFEKDDFRDVRFMPNAHTALGLGGWVSIEGSYAGMPVRMLVEPREDTSLLGNKNWSRFLQLEIKKWAAGPSSLPSHSHDTREVIADSHSASKLVRQGTRLL